MRMCSPQYQTQLGFLIFGPSSMEIKAMLKVEDMEDFHNPWCSLVVLVPKPDGTVRFCIDFKQVNTISSFNVYPVPWAEDLLDHLGQAQYITTLNLSKGYRQIPLSPYSWLLP